LISLVGLPPFAGFLGKLFVFKAGIENNFTWLVIIAVLTSVVSLYYYANIIKHMYFTKYEGGKSRQKVKAPAVYLIVIGFCALATILMVVIPFIFVDISQGAVVAGF
jgi:NADH:ubiquinone oxidoreductase subunit 2 (subunit N)